MGRASMQLCHERQWKVTCQTVHCIHSSHSGRILSLSDIYKVIRSSLNDREINLIYHPMINTIQSGAWEAGRPCGQGTSLVIRRSRVWVPLWPLAQCSCFSVAPNSFPQLHRLIRLLSNGTLNALCSICNVFFCIVFFFFYFYYYYPWKAARRRGQNKQVLRHLDVVIDNYRKPSKQGKKFRSKQLQLSFTDYPPVLYELLSFTFVFTVSPRKQIVAITKFGEVKGVLIREFTVLFTRLVLLKEVQWGIRG